MKTCNKEHRQVSFKKGDCPMCEKMITIKNLWHRLREAKEENLIPLNSMTNKIRWEALVKLFPGVTDNDIKIIEEFLNE